MAPVFEYAPAPESRAVVDIAPSYGLFIDGEFTEAADGRVFKTVSPSTEEVLSEVAEAGEADVNRAVAAARKAFEKWSALPGSGAREVPLPHRPHHPGTQPRAGRPRDPRQRQADQETRDADLPLVAAHFFYYAGWADKLDHAGYGANPRPLGVAGQVIPWNPPPDARVEDRSGARDRQHGRPQAPPRRPPVRAVLRGHLPSGGPAQGRRQHHHR